MKGVQILILHNSIYDTITLLAGFYCTLFTEQVPQWFQSLFEVVFQRTWLHIPGYFPNFWYFDRNINILRNYKNKKCAFKIILSPLWAPHYREKEKKNLCASKFRKKKKSRICLCARKKNIKNLLQLLVLPALSCESRISHDIGCQIAHFSNVFSID